MMEFPAKLTLINSRYVCVSIPRVAVHSLTDVWVWDIVFGRWGRIYLAHLDIFETVDNKMAAITNTPPNYGFVVFENSNSSEEGNEKGVVVFGKYQYSRQRMTQLQRVEIDYAYDVQPYWPSGAPKATIHPKVFYLTGTTWTEATRMSNSDFRCHYTAENHSIMIKGNFNLNYLGITVNHHGAR
jgi:hypothetical protein